MSVRPSAACPSSAARSHSVSGEMTPASSEPCERTRSGTNGDMGYPERGWAGRLLLEVWVLDQADRVAVRVGDDAHADAIAHVLHDVERLGTSIGDALPRRVAVLHAPVREHAAIAG